MNLKNNEINSKERITAQTPQRSYLYNLKPIGIGTPYTESLTSYISRLATEHNVTVNTLVKRAFIPVIEAPYLRNNLSQGVYGTTPKYLNGNSKISIDYVLALEKLTCRNDIIYLTMNMLSGVLSQNVIHSNRRWCPLCLNKWKQDSKVIYEPLIWYLSDINKCDIHAIQLQEKCLSCHKEQSFIHSKLSVGYCQYCSKWLGGETGNYIHSYLNEEEQFVISNFKELIEKAPDLTYLPTYKSISTRLLTIKERLNFSSNAMLAEFLGVHPSHLRQWIVNKNLPSLKSLLNLSNCVGTTVFKLFFEQSLGSISKSNNYKFIQSSKKNISLELMEEELKNALTDEFPKSLNQLSIEVGFAYMTAKRRFPELCKKIISNFEKYQEKVRLQEIERIEKLINDALIAEPPISLADFSKFTGVSISTAKRYAPDLCDELVAKYKNYRAQLKEEKIKNISVEIETQMIKLQDKGVYPSIKQIQKEISNPNVFIKDIYRAIWKEKMLKFGYKV